MPMEGKIDEGHREVYWGADHLGKAVPREEKVHRHGSPHGECGGEYCLGS